jgi:hypothetical protein
MVTSHI